MWVALLSISIVLRIFLEFVFASLFHAYASLLIRFQLLFFFFFFFLLTAFSDIVILWIHFNALKYIFIFFLSDKQRFVNEVWKTSFSLCFRMKKSLSHTHRKKNKSNFHLCLMESWNSWALHNSCFCFPHFLHFSHHGLSYYVFINCKFNMQFT